MCVHDALSGHDWVTTVEGCPKAARKAEFRDVESSGMMEGDAGHGWY